MKPREWAFISGQYSQIDDKHTGASNTIIPPEHPPFIDQLSPTYYTRILQHNN